MGRRPKPLKKMSTRKIALKTHRAVQKIEADEETKWMDQGHGTDAASPLNIEPFTTTDQNNSVIPLTDIQPRQSVNTALGPGLPTINTSNYRDGARCYISGVYLKAQFFFPQATDTTTQRYPPFANISWAVVKQLKNNSAVDPYTPTTLPSPNKVWQDPTAVGTASPPLWNQSQAPLASLLFKNMNNGHNYKVLRSGSFCLAAPVMCQQSVATTTGGNFSSFGSVPSFPRDMLPHQFSNNSCKTINIKLHPKTKVRFRQLPENVAQQTAVTNEEKTPLENGLYFMYWSDVGGSNLDSRFYSNDPAQYAIVQPRLVLNTRIRWKDV